MIKSILLILSIVLISCTKEFPEARYQKLAAKAIQRYELEQATNLAYLRHQVSREGDRKKDLELWRQGTKVTGITSEPFAEDQDVIKLINDHILRLPPDLLDSMEGNPLTNQLRRLQLSERLLEELSKQVGPYCGFSPMESMRFVHSQVDSTINVLAYDNSHNTYWCVDSNIVVTRDFLYEPCKVAIEWRFVKKLTIDTLTRYNIINQWVETSK